MKKLLSLILFLSFALFLISLSVFPLEDSDIWFHIKAGQWMWEHKTLASPDPFSWSVPNLPWTNLEWGIDVVLHLVERLGGLNGIIIAKAILITTTFLLLWVYQMKLSGSRNLLGLVILVVGIIASADRFMERVEHVGYFFLVVELGVLFCWKTRINTNKNTKIHKFLFPIAFFILFLLWANMHPSYVLGILLFALFICGEFAVWILFKLINNAIEIRERNSIFKRTFYRGGLLFRKLLNPNILPLKSIVTLGIVLLISIGASLINPYFDTAYRVVLGIVKAGTGSASTDVVLGTIIEYQSPFARGQRDTVYVQAYLWTLGLYWLVFIIGSIKNGIRLSYLALLSFITYISFTAVRQINVFVLAGFLPAMGTLYTRNNTNQNTKKHKSTPIRVNLFPIRVFSRVKGLGVTGVLTLILCIGFITASIYIVRNGYQLGRVYRTFSLGQRPIYADRALKFLDENKIYGNLYNAYGMGGYLIYGGYPERKVFIDGRAHYPEDFFAEHGSVSTSSAQAKKVMDKFKIDYVIIQHPETSGKNLADHLSDDRKNWALIYWDQYYLVYVRRTPTYCHPDRTPLSGEVEGSRFNRDSSTSLGMTKEVYCANWSDVVAKNEYTYGDPVLLRRPEKLQELSRPGKDALKPKVRTAGELNRNLELIPDNNRARIMLGGIFELIPDLTEAQKAYEEAVKRDPRFGLGHFLLGNILLKQTGLNTNQHEKEHESDTNTLSLHDGRTVDKILWNRAKQEFQQSFDLDPTVGSPLITLGIMEQQEGNLDRAIVFWEKATRVAPTDGQAFYQLGIVYSNERFDREKAKFYLTKYMTLADESDPKRERVRVILTRL